MIKKLKVKFVFITMCFITAMLAAIFVMQIHFTKYNLEIQSRQAIQMLLNDPFPLRHKEDGKIRLPYFLVQIDREGEIVASVGRYFDLSGDIPFAELTRKAALSKAQSEDIREYNLRFYKSAGPVTRTIIFIDTTYEQNTMGNLIQTSVIISVISFVCFLGLSILLANWAVKPVDHAWQQQKQFIADASHELKTPITVITTNAELLTQDTVGAEDRGRLTSNILTMSQQMRRLVEGMLELARVDNGAVISIARPCNFSEIATRSVLAFEPMFFEHNLSFDTELEEELWVKGSADHLGQVIDILLDNALKYSSETGDVKLSLNRHGNHCLLCVSSTGDPISEKDQKEIFKRFYRIDQARKQDGSYGLGLSIAQRIVEEHNGKIWVESRGHRNLFYVQLNLLHGALHSQNIHN